MQTVPKGSPPDRSWLLTGATGRIGRMLMRYWVANPPGTEVVALPRSAGFDDLPNYAGALFAFAGVTPGPGRDLTQNSSLAEASMEAALRAGVSRVLLTSSSAVYGVSATGTDWREDDIPRPAAPYGQAKLEMEAACDIWRARGLEVCCLRIGNVAGADALLLNAAHGPLRIDCFADGEGPLRSYIGPATLARVLKTLATCPAPLPRVLNIGAPRPIRMSDLARAAELDWGWTPAPATASQSITLDCTRLAALHPFDPEDSEPEEMVRQWTLLKDPS